MGDLKAVSGVAGGTLGFYWVDGDGNTVRTPGKVVPCPGMVALSGSLQVADGTASGTEIDLPFTGITSAATFVWIENLTGQELGRAWGGNWAPHLPAGGISCEMHPTPAAGGQIVALRFFLTQNQSGLGRINYVVGGS